MEEVHVEDNKPDIKPPPPPEDYVATAQKQALFGGQLIGCRKHPSSGKVVINPLFVDDTEGSTDEFITKDKAAHRSKHFERRNSNKDQYVTVFTISNGEVTFQRRGSQKWFTDGNTDGCQAEDEAKHASTPASVVTTSLNQGTSASPDRKRTSTSCSLERKYTSRPTSAEPNRKYDRETILKKQSRVGRRTDYGFIDNALVFRDCDRTSVNSSDLPTVSALTDDEKVAAQICNGSLHGTTSPEIILVHPNYQNSHRKETPHKECEKKSRHKKKSSRTKAIRKDVCEYRKVKACRLLGLTISMLILIGLAVALVIYFAKKDMVF